MQLVDLTFPSPEQNVALDEVLLELAETSPQASEYLRLWESPTPMVVVGRSSHVADEVDLTACRRSDVPVVRRSSGGAAVVAGPGCLMYAVVLSTKDRPQLATLAGAHATVLGALVAALSPLVPGVHRAGTSDLALHDRKLSGNSLRVKRSHVLYHGTLLYNFPLSLIAMYLRTPPRQPDYRAARAHDEFVTNIPVSTTELRQALVNQWQAVEQPLDLALIGKRVETLVAEKYSRPEWNFAL